MDFTIKLPEDSDYVGQLMLDGKPIDISGKTDPTLKSTLRLPNGRYMFQRMTFIDKRDVHALAAYGPAILFFQKIEGGTVLSIHGGRQDTSGKLLPTDGGLRVSDDDLRSLIDRVQRNKKRYERFLLTLETEKLGFFRRQMRQKVSGQFPQRTHEFRERYRQDRESSGITDSPFFWMWLFSQTGNHSGSPSFGEQERDTFTPGGGTFGGGGAEDEIQTAQNPRHEPIENQMGDGREDRPLPLIVDPFEGQVAGGVVAAAALAGTETAIAQPQSNEAPVSELSSSSDLQSADAPRESDISTSTAY